MPCCCQYCCGPEDAERPSSILPSCPCGPQIVSAVENEDGTYESFMVPYDKLVYAVGAQVRRRCYATQAEQTTG